MLPSPNRLRRSSEFGSTVREGGRVRRGRLVVHQHLGDDRADRRPATVGFVVSRAVGNSVVRHRVTRRLRHAARAHLADLPPGSRTVVRALPDAGTADFARLDADLGAALDALAASTARTRA